MKIRRSVLAAFAIVGLVGLSSLVAAWSNPTTTIVLGGENTDMVAYITMKKGQSECPVAILIGSEQEAEYRLRDISNLIGLGFAVVCFEYDKENFTRRFSALHKGLAKEDALSTNNVLWVGMGSAGEQVLPYLAAHPRPSPHSFIQLGGNIQASVTAIQALSEQRATTLDYSVVTLNDKGKFTLDEAAAINRARNQGASLKAYAIASPAEDFLEDRFLALRLVAERVMREFGSRASTIAGDFGSPTRSLGPIVLIIGISFLAAGAFFLQRKNYLSTDRPLLSGICVLCLASAVVMTFLHTFLPTFSTNQATLSIARRVLVGKDWRKDFDILAMDSSWRTRPLGHLLAYAELVNYTAFNLVNWKVSEQEYHDYVRSPVIDDTVPVETDWREIFWEYFYPKIRKENSPSAAAAILIRYLRESVLVSAGVDHTPMAVAWRRGLANPETFRSMHVAVLRSVAIPARIGQTGMVEIFDKGGWLPAPQPLRLHELR